MSMETILPSVPEQKNINTAINRKIKQSHKEKDMIIKKLEATIKENDLYISQLEKEIVELKMRFE